MRLGVFVNLTIGCKRQIALILMSRCGLFDAYFECEFK